MLGICRGMQLMNLHMGGSLHPHLPDLVGHDGHRVAPGVMAAHEVGFAGGSLAASALGRRACVQSYHHQGVALLGQNIDPVGWADDGTVEAIELRGHLFAMGVQWHPEEGEDLALFRMLVDFSARRPVSA
jgi:gamma-glutamyl-gamma-aminobutyrate hydrolase PuuD